MVGGNGPRRVLSLAAKYADEWNGIYRTPTQFAELNERLNGYLDALGRDRESVRRSQMKGLLFGRTDAELSAKLAGEQADNLWGRGLVVGSATQIIDQLGQLAEVGVHRVMLQWADLEDVDLLEAFAASILSALR